MFKWFWTIFSLGAPERLSSTCRGMFQLSQIYVVLHELLSPHTAVLWKCFTLRDTGLGRPAWVLHKRKFCILPVTSAECERSFSTLERLKTYLRSAMTTERQSGLAMMNIHYGRAIDIDEIVNIFATQHPRRLLLRDILTDEQWD